MVLGRSAVSVSLNRIEHLHATSECIEIGFECRCKAVHRLPPRIVASHNTPARNTHQLRVSRIGVASSLSLGPAPTATLIAISSDPTLGGTPGSYAAAIAGVCIKPCVHNYATKLSRTQVEDVTWPFTSVKLSGGRKQASK